MESSTFDRLTRALGGAWTRRRTVGSLLGGVAAGLGLAAVAGDEAAAAKKKPKKCKQPNTTWGKKGCCKPGRACCKGKCCGEGQVCTDGKCAAAPVNTCEFTKTATTWTLQGDCDLGESITIPDGVTLDGANHTIRLVGSQQAFAFVAIGSADGSSTVAVRNLVVDGAQLTVGCNASDRGVSGLGLYAATNVATNVTVRNLSCGTGILASGGVTLEDCQLDNVDPEGAGIFSGAIQLGIVTSATITGGSIQNLPNGEIGIYSVNNREGAVIVDGVTFSYTGAPGPEEARIAIYVEAGDLTVRNCSFSNVASGVIGIVRRAFEATNNTLVGTDSAITFAGISVSGATSGSITGNTVSNFKNNDPNTTACGIALSDNVGALTLSGNMFPDPPGNEQDICDSRPQ